jgi:hypothetical protein
MTAFLLFIFLVNEQVIVRKWNQQEERLVKVPEDEVCVYLSF